MSGIAGILDLPASQLSLEKMTATMRRRGPYTQYCCGREMCMLHTAKSPADAKPFVLEHEKERYVISCNGELYNSEQIRNDLLALGHSFQGEGCGELLLRAYLQWKEGTLLRLNGIYAFAILEEKAGRVFLARDRMGVKPLFYKLHGDGLLFASELKTILAYQTVEARLDKDGIGQLLLLGPGRIPGSGVFQDISELEPGCCAYYEKGRIRVRRYWKLEDREHSDSLSETAEKVRCLVLDAIRRQSAAESSLGTFLSGGLDSSLISAVCAKELARDGKQLDTFSVDYVDNDKYFRAGMFQPNSDPEYIRTMVEALNSRHHWTVLSPEELAAAVENSTVARDLPGMADVDASLALFCGQIKSKVDVALSGECADEIFGGYPWYRDPQIRSFDGFPWVQTTKERQAFLAPWLRERLDADDFVAERYRQALSECDILPVNNPTDHRIKELVNLNFRWFMQTLIDRNDRMSAASGLRVRVPLCDYRIAEYLYTVPWEMKEYGGREKGLLRYAMQDYLPEKVLYRKKSPYPKTHHPKYTELVSTALQQILLDREAPIFQIVDRQALEKLLHQDFAWPWYGQLMRRPQTIVFMLQINFWLQQYSVRIV